MLWSLKRVSAEGISADGGSLYYASKQVDVKTEKSTTKHFILDMGSGKVKENNYQGRRIIQRKPAVWYAQQDEALYTSSDQGKSWKKYFDGISDADNIQVSPDGKWVAFSREVMVKPVNGSDLYPDLPKTTAQVYTDLNYRHWDTWEDGKYSHVFIMRLDGGTPKDIMAREAHDCPQKPFGGSEDFMWSPDGKGIVYVCKKKEGKEYATSTNTDLYYYDIVSNTTTNWTVGMMGYDTQPVFNANGKKIAWTSMKRDGYEADKNDLYVMDLGNNKNVWKINITEDWDGTVESFVWNNTGNKIYFNAPWKGTV